MHQKFLCTFSCPCWLMYVASRRGSGGGGRIREGQRRSSMSTIKTRDTYWSLPRSSPAVCASHDDAEGPRSAGEARRDGSGCSKPHSQRQKLQQVRRRTERDEGAILKLRVCSILLSGARGVREATMGVGGHPRRPDSRCIQPGGSSSSR